MFDEANSFMCNADLTDSNSLTHLINRISPELENEVDLIEQSNYYDDTTFGHTFQSSMGISMVSLNCQCLNTKKVDALKLFLSSMNSDTSPISCIVLQETWCDSLVDMSFFSLPNYNMVSKPTRISAHGGLIIYIHDSFQYKQIDIIDDSLHFENICIEVWNKYAHFDKFLICDIYKPPSGTTEHLVDFTNKFTQWAAAINEKSKKSYLCGDFNINLLQIQTNQHFNQFYDSLTSTGFIPKITLPTRISETSATLIDNIFTNNIDRAHVSGILSRKFSDHQMIFSLQKCNKCQKLKHNEKYIEVELTSQDNLDKFAAEIKESKICERINSNADADPNANLDILTNIINAAKNNNIPQKVKKFNKRRDKKEPWMTNELLLMVNRKNELYVDWKRSAKHSENYNGKKVNFITYEKIVDNEIVQAKKIYYSNVFHMYKSSMKKTWQIINETLSRKKVDNILPDTFIKNGNELSDPKEIAKAFNEYFSKIGSNLASNINCTEDGQSYKVYLQNPTLKKFAFKKVNDNEVLSIINNLKNKKSRGADNISNQLLKTIKQELCKPLTIIINQMIETGVYTEKFKISKITPIYKKNERTNIANYRPISLLPTLSKIFERVIHTQLYTYFDENKLLSEQQYGFREKHSTELAAVKLVDYINHEMDIGNTPEAIFIDLSKAFDTLNFDILIHKLQFYGLSGNSLALMKSYVTGRMQYVLFNKTKSDLAIITTGIPQGSILGPLLFSIYVNDIINSSDKLQYLLYADDTTLYFNREHFTPHNANLEINNELSKVMNWLKLNKLSLNVQKTKYMTFHKSQKNVTPLNLSIDDIPIDSVDEFNYLGIILHERLTWKNHINMVTNKIAKVSGILNRLKHIFPQNVLLSLYHTLIISQINYGMLLWGSDIRSVEKYQKKAIRNITNSHILAHTEPLLKDLGLLKVGDIFKLRLLKFYYKLMNNELPSYFVTYVPIITNETYILNHDYALRTGARRAIRTPRIHHVFAESTVLYKLIKLLNSLYLHEPNIMSAIQNGTHSYTGICFYAKQIFLQQYTYTCNILNCYTCKHAQ